MTFAKFSEPTVVNDRTASDMAVQSIKNFLEDVGLVYD
jgi:hypothetical protein